MKAKPAFYLGLVIAGSALLGIGELFTIFGVVMTVLGLFLLLLEAIKGVTGLQGSNAPHCPLEDNNLLLHERRSLRLADKLLLCAAGIYTALQCARILDHFTPGFYGILFIGIFLLLAAIEYCKLLRAYFKKKRKHNETTS